MTSPFDTGEHRLAGLERRVAELEALLGRAAHAPPGSVRLVAQAVARRAGLTMPELLGQDRQADRQRARHIAMALARTLTGASYPSIARVFRRDHSTVMHALRAVARRAQTDPAYAAELRQAEAACRLALPGRSQAPLATSLGEPSTCA